MERKCIGCGAILQNQDVTKEGYVVELSAIYCRRCFCVKNYGQYEVVKKTEADFEPILKEIQQSGDLVLYILDLFHMEKDILKFLKRLSNPCILVLSKRDILPKKVSDEKLISYVQERYPFVTVHIISSYKNSGFDALYQDILEKKQSKNVYVLGNTNAGKSTFLNRMLKNYGGKEGVITTSVLPNTTLSILKIDVNEELTMVDTPGFLVSDSLLLKVEPSMVKKIMPKKEIRPRTYQIKALNSFLIEDFVRIDTDDQRNSITFYLSNELSFLRIRSYDSRLKDFEKYDLEVGNGEDVVIEGLGFLKIVRACHITIYTLPNVSIYTRKNLI